MDEYLSEKEQIEQIREWWRENGWYLMGGAALALVGYFGYGQYQAYQDQQAEEASAIYAQLRQTLEDDRPGADELLAQLTEGYGSSPYTDQARLLMAREFLISNTDRAASELRTVMESSQDPGLSMVARMRLARVLAYQEDYDDALAVLVVESPGEFAAQLKAIEGDIHMARGALTDARQAYTEALTAQGAAGLDRTLLQIKLGELPVPGLGLFPSGAETSVEAGDDPLQGGGDASAREGAPADNSGSVADSSEDAGAEAAGAEPADAATAAGAEAE